MIKCLVVEGDKLSAELLESKINSNFSDIVVIECICSTLTDAKTKIYEFHPDIIFLSIEIPFEDILDFFDFYKNINFEIIITSFSPNDALKAFKLNALDFIVKPIQIEDLQKSIEKYKKKLKLTERNIPKILNNKIGLPTNKGVIFINPDLISYCQADNTYTNVRLSDGTTISISRSLKEVEYTLIKLHFFRIHKSYLINLKKISNYIKSDGGHIMMENSEDMLPISKNYKDELLKNLNIL